MTCVSGLCSSEPAIVASVHGQITDLDLNKRFQNKLKEIASIDIMFMRAEENIFKTDTWNSPFYV